MRQQIDIELISKTDTKYAAKNPHHLIRVPFRTHSPTSRQLIELYRFTPQDLTVNKSTSILFVDSRLPTTKKQQCPLNISGGRVPLRPFQEVSDYQETLDRAQQAHDPQICTYLEI